MSEKSLVWQNLELQDEIAKLKSQLETRQEAYGLICHKCDMWRAAAELSDTHRKELQLDFDKYRKDIEFELVAARAYDLMREQLDQANLRTERYRGALEKIIYQADEYDDSPANELVVIAREALEAK